MSDETIRAISMWQPWAYFVASDSKRYETRSFDTEYRGLLLIHAAKTKKGLPLYYAGPAIPHSLFHYMAIICAVRLVSTHRTEDIIDKLPPDELEKGNYSPGRFAWKFEEVQQFKPVPYKGQQGFFYVNRDIIVDIPGSDDGNG